MSTKELELTSDHELLLGGVEDVKTENRSSAARAARLLEFFRRQEAVEAARAAEVDHFAMTARQQTTIEISELWALPASWVRRQLNNALWVSTHFSYLEELGEAGSIDSYRSSLIAETARQGLATDAEYAVLARRLTPFLKRHLRDDGLITCSHKQLRNKLTYEIRVIRSHDADEKFRQIHEAREVLVGDGDQGISWLTIAGTTDQIALASHRLTLSARALRAGGDQRTVEQIRADLALDLIIGKNAGDVPAFARPVINLTVPIQTVMGLADHPGVLSGGQVIPAALARTIAQRPGATWHRMLTDPAGRAVELSTERYRPTRAIWEEVVATHPTCFRQGCDQPSTTCDLDHREPWPVGRTAPINLRPACRTDHRAKHAPGFGIRQTSDGGFALTTPAGFTHQVLDAVHPMSEEWPEVPGTIQYSATELVEAITMLRERREAERPRRFDLEWEFDINLGLSYDAA